MEEIGENYSGEFVVISDINHYNPFLLPKQGFLWKVPKHNLDWTDRHRGGGNMEMGGWYNSDQKVQFSWTLKWPQVFLVAQVVFVL